MHSKLLTFASCNHKGSGLLIEARGCGGISHLTLVRFQASTTIAATEFIRANVSQSQITRISLGKLRIPFQKTTSASCNEGVFSHKSKAEGGKVKSNVGVCLA